MQAQNSFDQWQLLDAAMRRLTADTFLLNDMITCLVCKKEVKPRRRLEGFRQHAFTIIAMQSHIKAHIRRGEITWQVISQNMPSQKGGSNEKGTESSLSGAG